MSPAGVSAEQVDAAGLEQKENSSLRLNNCVRNITV